MAATLYLGIDGVLHPRAISFTKGERLPKLRDAGHSLFENHLILERALEQCPHTVVIVHSWWVPLLGYRRTVEAIPERLRTRIIGATCRGNRRLPFALTSATTRREWLRQDILRRRPATPVLLDCDFCQVLSMLADSACVVDARMGLATIGAAERLVALLQDANGSD
ncbi:HAD domain-containing protein [Cupriavidus sp. amp6]|uniref:HAD domain-containing protein n=1 Tax=Cupriavidus sp. amp6 TaxID=388051 RepID=UPI00068824CF|nr:HAD domain-containing protein [Cupriavidus sp. amp6]